MAAGDDAVYVGWTRHDLRLWPHPFPAFAMLRLELLGGFRALDGSAEIAGLSRQPRRAAVLVYVATERRVQRERLISVMWPEADGERGRHSLNQSIYYLRRLVGAEWVEIQGDVLVAAPWVRTDVEELQRAADQGDHESVLSLYRGPLLGGTGIAPTAEFAMWTDQRNTALERLHRISRREVIGRLLDGGRTEEALRAAEEWCRLNPLEDEAQHRYIELLAGSGQRGAALRQYSSYRRLLQEQELEPMDETVALIERVQSGESLGGPAVAERSLDEAGSAGGGLPRGGERQDRTPEESARPRPLVGAILGSRRGLSLLLAGVFTFNVVETAVEEAIAARSAAVGDLRLRLATAAHALEGWPTFVHHDLANDLAVVGFTLAYFVVFPAILAIVGVTLSRRESIGPYRTFALALAAAYAISLPFFLFFPVPERWWLAESGAIVLSDLWSSRWIDLFRPFSGLDNSFPSTHASLTTVAVVLGFVYRLRMRWSILLFGGAVVLSTYALGIHWLSDIAAGIAVGMISCWVALGVQRGLIASGPSVGAADRARPESRMALEAVP